MIQNIAENLTHRFFIDNFRPELIHANVIPNNLDNRFQSFAFEIRVECAIVSIHQK